MKEQKNAENDDNFYLFRLSIICKEKKRTPECITMPWMSIKK